MPRLTSRYSGVARYLVNASFHADSDSGGTVPTIGCHSVIDNPECVRRVTPPTTTIANTSAQQTNSHVATLRRASKGSCTARAPGAGADGAKASTDEFYYGAGIGSAERGLPPIRSRLRHGCARRMRHRVPGRSRRKHRHLPHVRRR